MLFNLNIIAASPLAITAYALPHIVLAVAVNSRLQRNWRHSFWSEIYETVLALFLVRVTLVTLWDPKRGKFNVTNKGGLLENGYFDLGAVYPNLIMAFLLIAGMARGIISMIVFNNEALVFQALLLNTIWAGISLMVVMAALAVGRETRQVRSRARVRAVLPVTLYLPDGRTVLATTRDLSQGGAGMVCERPDGVPDDALVHVEFNHGGELITIPARILRWDQRLMQASWQPQTVADEARIVQAVFGRADSWVDWANYPVDRPVASLWRVLVSIRGLFRPPDRAPARPRQVPPADGGQPVPPQPGQIVPGAATPAPSREVAGTPAGAAVAGVLLAVGLALTPPAHAQTGSSGFSIRPVPGAAPVYQPVQNAAPPSGTNAPSVSPGPGAAATPSPGQVPLPYAVPPPATTTTVVGTPTTTVVTPSGGPTTTVVTPVAPPVTTTRVAPAAAPVVTTYPTSPAVSQPVVITPTPASLPGAAPLTVVPAVP